MGTADDRELLKSSYADVIRYNLNGWEGINLRINICQRQTSDRRGAEVEDN